jgi:hypothetical protein
MKSHLLLYLYIHSVLYKNNATIIKYLKTIFLTLILSSGLFVNVASAGLITGATTDTSLDTVSGLEWLDFSFTAGMSYNDVLSSNYVISEGYEIATLDQVKDLWVNVGLFTDIDAAANSILSNMGCMSYLYSSRHNCDQVGEEWTGAFYKSNGANYNLTLIDTTNGANALFFESWAASPLKSDSFRVDAAAYLVRSATSAPEPSTLAIFALGMMGLAVRRLNKNS